MISSKKYCPSWVYDCVVAQAVTEFILYGVDLIQPCRKFSLGLSDKYEEVSLEELVRVSEMVVVFLHENNINEKSVDLLSGFAYFRFYYTKKTKLAVLAASSTKTTTASVAIAAQQP
jgi:hypothetical protein